MGGLFSSPTITLPATPPVPPPVRQPTPTDAGTQAAQNRAQQQLLNMQGVAATDLSGPGPNRGNRTGAYMGTALGA